MTATTEKRIVNKPSRRLRVLPEDFLGGFGALPVVEEKGLNCSAGVSGTLLMSRGLSTTGIILVFAAFMY